ncbi:hypothetical protein [Cellulosimicrobium sp. Marseille-Q4280]|uniref:hypothetical protein n=1 Tax=Cellulosimicrobium sp. Marseille-Q4280 TaxID=2937992 RepID=UPI00203C3230|nr:hypothetical protein [Cellulosimicrobium sp. Marseille-Q4280]
MSGDRPVRVSIREVADALTWGNHVWDNPEDDSEDFTATASGTTDRFDAAVRALLGAAADANVVVKMAGGNNGTTYTREEWETFTVAAGDRDREFVSMPDLIAALDVAEAGGPIGDRAGQLVGQRVLADFGGGATFQAEVVRATAHAVTLRGRRDARPRYRDGRYGHPYREAGGTGVEGDLLLWADPRLVALTPTT